MRTMMHGTKLMYCGLATFLKYKNDKTWEINFLITVEKFFLLPGVFAGDVSFEVKLCCDEVDSAPSVFLEVCSPFFGAGNRLEIHVLESLECYKKQQKSE